MVVVFFSSVSRQSSHKKKLNTYISFPEVLDMSPFMEEKGIPPLMPSVCV